MKFDKDLLFIRNNLQMTPKGRVSKQSQHYYIAHNHAIEHVREMFYIIMRCGVGPTFTWKEYPDYIANQAKEFLKYKLPETTKMFQELRDNICFNSAKIELSILMKDAPFLPTGETQIPEDSDFKYLTYACTYGFVQSDKSKFLRALKYKFKKNCFPLFYKWEDKYKAKFKLDKVHKEAIKEMNQWVFKVYPVDEQASVIEQVKPKIDAYFKSFDINTFC